MVDFWFVTHVVSFMKCGLGVVSGLDPLLHHRAPEQIL